MSFTTQPSERFRAHAMRLRGPILVLGASGFVGANLLRSLLACRNDAFGTAGRQPAWRLAGLPAEHVHTCDLLIESHLDLLLDTVRPQTIFNCTAYGAYSFETDAKLIYQTNFQFVTRLMERLAQSPAVTYIHTGSSSEYGDRSAGSQESWNTAPNSDYAVSKAAAANLLYFHGKHRGLRCANLRLYSVYGPLEDSSRLIPRVVMHGMKRTLPEFVDPETSRDFVFVDDVVEAMVHTAAVLEPTDYGDSFNIGTGRKTTIREIASLAQELFDVPESPRFDRPSHAWDRSDWYADTTKTASQLGWTPSTDLRAGLLKTRDWLQTLPDTEEYERRSKKFGLDTHHSVTAIIACYRDGQAIPIMYDRLKQTFRKLNVDHEIIFVNDCSPDDSEEVIRRISQDDPKVIGISHSRNFGSQAAFASGMQIASKNSCVLLDGDLQDPPELIADFVAKWREGYDVVYGRRVQREATPFMQFAYKAFYRVFNFFSYIPVPHDAGDFSLLDRRVVNAMLRFPERDLFLRGVRAFAGFRQTGVDYIRPERMFGRSTNNFLKNVNWAKKGILSFSNTPLSILSAVGTCLLALTCLLMIGQVVIRVLRPDLVPAGVTTTLLFIMFFGSLGIFSTAVLGEYLAKVFEEVKQRPLYIRRSIIRDGDVRPAVDRLTEGRDHA